MAKVKFRKKDFEKYMKLTEENLNLINMFGTPIEVFDEDVEIEIFPNRPDLLSMQGLIRALKAFSGKETGLKEYKINPPQKNYTVKIDSSVKSIRPYTVCAIVKGIKFTDEKIKEIIDMQEKLHTTIGRNRKKLAIGIYPLDKINLPITYEARKPQEIKFIPLESSQEMNGLQILQKHPAGKDYAHLLEGLDKFPVFVDSKGKILSLPPIINSNETGRVTEETKDIFIECSGFDLETLKKTLNIIVTTFAEMSGEIYSMKLEYGKDKLTTPDLTPEKMQIKLENANKLIGLQLKEKDLEKLLPRMGLEYKKGQVLIPAWRTDILHEVDIIEDIAIAYGYDLLMPEIPQVATIGQESPESKITSKISDILSGLGLIEISSYHLIKEDEAKKMKIKDNEKIELEDSKTEYKLLRPNLQIPALRILSENKDNEYPQKIFELGTIFNKNEKEDTGIKESTNLLISSTPSNFTEMKQILDYLFNSLSLEYSLNESSKKELIDGRTGSIILNGKEIGYIGEVHPDTLRNWNLKMPLSILEISLDEIFSQLD